MSVRRWGAWAAASGGAAFLLGSVKPVLQLYWEIDLLALLIAELPALLWRRRGGSPPETLGIAVAVPLLVFAPMLVPGGHPEDRLIPFIVIALGLVSTVVTALICVFVRPARDGE